MARSGRRAADTRGHRNPDPVTSVASDQRVLSTLNADGSRRWLSPRPSPGRWLNRRRAVGYSLIALFVALPHLRVRGRPPLLLDVVHRELTIAGLTLYPTDTLLLALLILIVFVSVFLLTSLLGRVWCGWMCPQTIYLELVFRPIERLFEGGSGRAARTEGWRKPAKLAAYLLLSLWLAHTFLAYFVPTTELYGWMARSPLAHPVSFLLVLAVTGLMLFDFGVFREQTCIVACPYGRLQSVMLDLDSVIIGYDRARGEPRGRGKRASRADVALPLLEAGSSGDAAQRRGDCIDCRMCITTCPTGIDIRDGLQMECVNCTQCIDACDAVMDKIGLPRGLIRYSSQRMLEGHNGRLLRPRVLGYAAIILLLVGAFALVLSMRGSFHAAVLRGPGMPFTVMGDGFVGSPIQLKIHNRSDGDRRYSIDLIGVEGGQLVTEHRPAVVRPGQRFSEPMLLRLPRAAFTSPRIDVALRITDDLGATRDLPYRALGPAVRPAPSERAPSGRSEVDRGS